MKPLHSFAAGLPLACSIIARRIAFALLCLGAGLALLQPCTGQSGTWTATGSLVERRQLHRATLLPNGKVLVVGGEGISGPLGCGSLSSAELYNQATGTWTRTGDMTFSRWLFTATLLPNGKVLVAGGSDCEDNCFRTAELYDPDSGTWTVTGNPASSHERHTATLLPNGKVLVAGGDSCGGENLSAELYDPATGIWTATGSTAVGHGGSTATLLPNGKVLVTGEPSELYDPASGTWTATGSLVTARFGHSATLLPNGKVLVAGGRDDSSFVPLASAELYDPVSGTWTATGSLATPCTSHTATLLPNGKVLVAAGDDSSFLPLASAELYDPASGTWTVTGSLNTARFFHTATLLPNGKVLVAGGYNNGIELASAELYTPSSVTTSYRDVILADNPIMYWRLGESSGTIAYDESANYRDGTYIHHPSLGLHGAIANDTNTSVGFNGFCQWAGWIPTSSYSGAFTVEAWVKEKQIHPVETFFDTRTKTGEFSFDFKFDTLAGKEIHFDVGDGTQWLSTSGVPFDFKRNVWYYVAAVVTRRGATYYVDGSAIGSVTYRGIPLLFDGTHKVQIGTNTRYDSEWFDGAIDEVAVYDCALTAEQIAAHYAAGTGN